MESNASQNKTSISHAELEALLDRQTEVMKEGFQKSLPNVHNRNYRQWLETIIRKIDGAREKIREVIRKTEDPIRDRAQLKPICRASEKAVRHFENIRDTATSSRLRKSRILLVEARAELDSKYDFTNRTKATPQPSSDPISSAEGQGLAVPASVEPSASTGSQETQSSANSGESANPALSSIQPTKLNSIPVAELTGLLERKAGVMKWTIQNRLQGTISPSYRKKLVIALTKVDGIRETVQKAIEKAQDPIRDKTQLKPICRAAMKAVRQCESVKDRSTRGIFKKSDDLWGEATNELVQKYSLPDQLPDVRLNSNEVFSLATESGPAESSNPVSAESQSALSADERVDLMELAEEQPGFIRELLVLHREVKERIQSFLSEIPTLDTEVLLSALNELNNRLDQFEKALKAQNEKIKKLSPEIIAFNKGFPNLEALNSLPNPARDACQLVLEDYQKMYKEVHELLGEFLRLKSEAEERRNALQEINFTMRKIDSFNQRIEEDSKSDHLQPPLSPDLKNLRTKVGAWQTACAQDTYCEGFIKGLGTEISALIENPAVAEGIKALEQLSRYANPNSESREPFSEINEMVQKIQTSKKAPPVSAAESRTDGPEEETKASPFMWKKASPAKRKKEAINRLSRLIPGIMELMANRNPIRLFETLNNLTWKELQSVGFNTSVLSQEGIYANPGEMFVQLFPSTKRYFKPKGKR